MQSRFYVGHSSLAISFASALMLVSVGAAFGGGVPSASNSPAGLPQSVIQKPQQKKSLRVAFLLAPIHSRATLHRYLTDTKMSNSPLRFLSPGAQKEFLKSLKFNKNGLTAFYYGVFDEVTTSQEYQILQLFGAQHMAGMFGVSSVNSPTDAMIMSADSAGPDILPTCGPVKGGAWNCFVCIGYHTCELVSQGYVCMSTC